MYACMPYLISKPIWAAVFAKIYISYKNALKCNGESYARLEKIHTRFNCFDIEQSPQLIKST